MALAAAAVAESDKTEEQGNSKVATYFQIKAEGVAEAETKQTATTFQDCISIKARTDQMSFMDKNQKQLKLPKCMTK